MKIRIGGIRAKNRQAKIESFTHSLIDGSTSIYAVRGDGTVITVNLSTVEALKLARSIFDADAKRNGLAPMERAS